MLNTISRFTSSPGKAQSSIFLPKAIQRQVKLHFGEEDVTPDKTLPLLSSILKGQYLQWANTRKVESLEALKKELNELNNDNAVFFISLSKACRAEGKAFWPYAQLIATTLATKSSLSDKNRAYGFIGLGSLLTDEDARLKQYEEALKLARKSGILAVIGDVYLAMGTAQLPNYKYYFTMAEGITRELNDLAQQARIQLGIGHKEKNIVKQRIHYRKAESLAIKAGNYAVEAYANIALGNTYRGSEQIPYFDKALKRGITLNNEMIMAKAWLGLGRVRGLPFEKAEEYFNKALNVGWNREDALIKTQAYLALGHLYANQRKDNHNAYLWYSEAEKHAPNASLQNKALKGINETRSRL